MRTEPGLVYARAPYAGFAGGPGSIWLTQPHQPEAQTPSQIPVFSRLQASALAGSMSSLNSRGFMEIHLPGDAVQPHLEPCAERLPRCAETLPFGFAAPGTPESRYGAQHSEVFVEGSRHGLLQLSGLQHQYDPRIPAGSAAESTVAALVREVRSLRERVESLESSFCYSALRQQTRTHEASAAPRCATYSAYVTQQAEPATPVRNRAFDVQSLQSEKSSSPSSIKSGLDKAPGPQTRTARSQYIFECVAEHALRTPDGHSDFARGVAHSVARLDNEQWNRDSALRGISNPAKTTSSNDTATHERRPIPEATERQTIREAGLRVEIPDACALARSRPCHGISHAAVPFKHIASYAGSHASNVATSGALPGELQSVQCTTAAREKSTSVDPKHKMRRHSVWSEEEDCMFRRAYATFGCKWNRIKSFLPNKTRQQVQSHGTYLIKRGVIRKFNSRSWTRRQPSEAA
jgi:hypothetical protein